MLCADLGRGPSLIRTVVPFQQVGIGSTSITEPGQLAGPSSPPERADKDSFKRLSLEPLPQAAGIGFPMRRQRDIGPARMLLRDRPRRLAVPCQVDLWE